MRLFWTVLWTVLFPAPLALTDPLEHVDLILEDLVRPGAQEAKGGDFAALRTELEAAELHGYLALLYYWGVADAQGELRFPAGFPRDVLKGRQHLVKALRKRRSLTRDPWAFTLLGFLLSIGSQDVADIDLKVVDGPEVVVANPNSILDEDADPERPPDYQGALSLDRVGAAFWEAAERREPIGSIVFASMVRRGLTDVPLSWSRHDTSKPLLHRTPDLLIAKQSLASERACRALGILVEPAKAASRNEEPLLDKTALNWKAWRHHRQLPSDDDWQQTKEYVDAIKHGAEVMQEPTSMRELAAVHFQGHSEGKVQQNKTVAEHFWRKAAESGDLWSAWHATLSYIRDGEIDAAVPYLDIVSNASLMPLKFMALHFKYRFGIGQEKDPVMAGNYLKASADLGNANAQLILAHSYMGFKQGNMEGVEPPGGPDKSAALVYYKAAAANGRLVSKLNAGLLIAQGADTAVKERDLQCTFAYKELVEVVYAAYPPAHLLFAHARRAFILGDLEGSRLRFSLLSDAGFLLGHLNAAWLWDMGTDKLTFWNWYRSSKQSKKALRYYQRAALSGHVTSMTEVSVRLLKEAETLEASGGTAQECDQRCSTEQRAQSVRSRISELQQSAYRWTAIAAEQGEARAIFDQAYMLQFGVGVEKNEQLAYKLYEKLSDKSWPSRIAALSWLGLTVARKYFLHLREAFPLLHAAGQAVWILGHSIGAGLGNIDLNADKAKIGKKPQQRFGGRHSEKGQIYMTGRLVFLKSQGSD